MSKSKDIASVAAGLPVERPTYMGDVAQSRGNEGVQVEDMAIPRLSIVQDLSPQHKKTKPEYIDGAEPKMVFNTVTNALYPDGVLVIPVLFRKEYVIWKDIDSGGGFKGAYSTLGEAETELQKLEDKNDCEVVDTAQHFVLVVDPSTLSSDSPSFTEAVVSMSKSQMKVSRKFNSMIQTQGGDRWERMYHFTVVDDQNAAGQEYYNWKPTQLGYVSEALFQAAERLYEAVRSGAMDVSRQTAAADTSAEGFEDSGAIDEEDDF